MVTELQQKHLLIFRNTPFSSDKRICSKMASLTLQKKCEEMMWILTISIPSRLLKKPFCFGSLSSTFTFDFVVALVYYTTANNFASEKNHLNITKFHQNIQPQEKKSNSVRFGCDIYRWNRTDLPKSTTKTEYYVTRSWKSKNVMTEAEITVVPSKSQSKINI